MSEQNERYLNNPPTRHPRVRGRCPSCGSETLFLGSNGYVTCSVLGCKEPGAATDLLSAARPREKERELVARLREQIGRVTSALLREDSQRAETLFHAASGLCIVARTAAAALARPTPAEEQLDPDEARALARGLADVAAGRVQSFESIQRELAALAASEPLRERLNRLADDIDREGCTSAVAQIAIARVLREAAALISPPSAPAHREEKQ